MQRNQLLQNSYSFRSKFKSEFLEFSDHTVTRPFSKKEHLSFFLFFFFLLGKDRSILLRILKLNHYTNSNIYFKKKKKKKLYIFFLFIYLLLHNFLKFILYIFINFDS